MFFKKILVARQLKIIGLVYSKLNKSTLSSLPIWCLPSPFPHILDQSQSVLDSTPESFSIHQTLFTFLATVLVCSLIIAHM